MESKNITILIAAFLAIIVGISLIGVVATEGNSKVDLVNVSGESISYASAREAATGAVDTTAILIANPPTGWRITGCPITSFVLYNSSGSLTNVVDYVFTASTGSIAFNNTANVNTSLTNTTTATYTYCNVDYLTQGWQRSIISLVPGFFALALMAIGVGLFYQVLSSEGLLGL